MASFDDGFDEITRRLADIGDRARREADTYETAREMVADAVHLVRATAPDGLPPAHAWLGAVQIVTEFAHRVAHEGMESEG